MTVREYIANIDKDVNDIEKLCFHRWLRWELTLYRQSLINMTDFKNIIGVSIEEDYSINPEFTKDLMDYVSGKELLSEQESFKRNIEFNESNDYYEIIENKNIEFNEAIEKLKKITLTEMDPKDFDTKEIKNENIILSYNLYNIWLDNGSFKFFESKQLSNWGISSDKWIKNARKMKRKLLFLLVDSLMKLWDDIVRFQNVLFKLWKFLQYKVSYIKKVYQKIDSLQKKYWAKELWESLESITLEEKSNEFDVEESLLIDERVFYEPGLLINESSEEIKEAEIESIRSSLLDQAVLKEELEDYNNELRFKRDCKELLYQWLNKKIN